MDRTTMHIAMYPWFAFGHLNPFLNLSNKLAERGHKTTFFLPTKTQSKLQHLNLYPDLIHFFPLIVPHVEGLPPGAETTGDVPPSLQPLIMTAMDLTQPDIEAALRDLKPDFVFFDFTHWLPPLARQLGIKSVHYCITCAAMAAYVLVPASEKLDKGGLQLSEDELMQQPLGFPPSSAIKLHRHEARAMAFLTYREYGSSVSFHERLIFSLRDCDAIGYRSCKEMEGPYCDFIEKHYGKPVLLSGPLLPKPPPPPTTATTATNSLVENKWGEWLDGFEPRSVVFCAFGSECFMKKDQFQELLLGFELTGLPFFVALKPPIGVETIDEALPEGFKKRVEGRGIVEGGWVQQQAIMCHPSVGCFVSHCGLSSLTEALVNVQPQLVLLPNMGDQYIIGKLMGGDLKVGVEVERGEEDGLFTKENVCEAVKSVTDEDSEIGKQVRANRLKLREFLLSEGLESVYMDSFINKLWSMIR